METLWLLAKINFYFQIAEKVAYGGIGLWVISKVIRYKRDYTESVEEEKYFNIKE